MSHDGATSKFDHILVPRAALPKGKPLSFDLFVSVAGRYVKVANRNEAIDEERLSRYLDHERDILYIDRGSLERFMDEKFGGMLEMISSPKIAIEERSEWFVRCLELGFVDLKVVRPHIDKFQRIDLLVEWSFEFFRKRELRQVLVRTIFRAVEQPISKRAIFGASLTLNLVLDQNDCTAGTFRSLFLGSLYRDLAVSHEGGDLHQKAPGEFESPTAYADFKNHPLLSMETLRKFNVVDDIVRAMVEQHHELPRGNGFPRGLKRAETFQSAQYLGLADFVVTELERFKATHGSVQETKFLDHLKAVMPEENLKNLGVLIRAMKEIF